MGIEPIFSHLGLRDIVYSSIPEILREIFRFD